MGKLEDKRCNQGWSPTSTRACTIPSLRITEEAKMDVAPSLGKVNEVQRSVCHSFVLRGAAKKKTVFFWEISPKCRWVGWLTPKQGPNTSKPPQITPKIAFFDPNFTLRFPKSYKNPGVGK